jgi:hypothetical protein
MHTLSKATLLWVSVLSGPAWAYGGGGGGGPSCTEPRFFQPAPSGSAASLAEFRVIASGNTDPSTLTVEIGGEKVRPEITPRGNGEWDVTARPAAPVTQPGKLRIALNARSKDGCWGFQPYFLDIKP